MCDLVMFYLPSIYMVERGWLIVCSGWSRHPSCQFSCAFCCCCCCCRTVLQHRRDDTNLLVRVMPKTCLYSLTRSMSLSWGHQLNTISYGNFLQFFRNSRLNFVFAHFLSLDGGGAVLQVSAVGAEDHHPRQTLLRAVRVWRHRGQRSQAMALRGRCALFCFLICLMLCMRVI